MQGKGFEPEVTGITKSGDLYKTHTEKLGGDIHLPLYHYLTRRDMLTN